MLIEAVTLHRRFPYSVLGGLFFLDAGAAADATGRRKSTFENAHMRFRLFTGRDDPAGRDEQFESFHLVLLDPAGMRAFAVGRPGVQVPRSRSSAMRRYGPASTSSLMRSVLRRISRERIS